MVQKAVGVIGGLGPRATVEFMRRILDITPARQERDHLRLIVDSNPKVPDINAAALDLGPSAAPDLIASALRLQKSGADFVVMVCNAAHIYQSDIIQALSIPFVSMIDEAVSAIKTHHPHCKRVGILATDGCLRTQIYQRGLEQHQLVPILLNEPQLAKFMVTIRAIKAGEIGEQSKAGLLDSVSELVALKAEIVILACSEIGLVDLDGDAEVPLLDPSHALADASVRMAFT